MSLSLCIVVGGKAELKSLLCGFSCDTFQTGNHLFHLSTIENLGSFAGWQIQRVASPSPFFVQHHNVTVGNANNGVVKVETV